MDLQPIYPGGLAHPQTLLKACSNCALDVSTNTGFFDQCRPGTYLCWACTGYHLTYNQRINALVSRDLRELQTLRYPEP